MQMSGIHWKEVNNYILQEKNQQDLLLVELTSH